MSARSPRVPYVVWLALLLAMSACAQPGDPIVAHLRDGEASLAEGAGDRALAAYHAALTLAPGNRRALLGVLRAEIERDDGESALLALRSLESEEGGGAPAADRCAALRLAAEQRLAGGDDSAALEVAREHRATGCNGGLAPALEAGALIAVGDRERARGRSDLALLAYEAATLADPAHSHAFAAAGELLLGQGRTDEAVSLLAKGLEHHPEDRALRDLMLRALSMR